MIRLRVAVENEKLITQLEDENITLNEASLIVFELERIKQKLLSLEWKEELYKEGPAEPEPMVGEDEIPPDAEVIEESDDSDFVEEE